MPITSLEPRQDRRFVVPAGDLDVNCWRAVVSVSPAGSVAAPREPRALERAILRHEGTESLCGVHCFFYVLPHPNLPSLNVRNHSNVPKYNGPRIALLVSD
jgi:hypothetical protein